jgi:hypothetical protein
MVRKIHPAEVVVEEVVGETNDHAIMKPEHLTHMLLEIQAAQAEIVAALPETQNARFDEPDLSETVVAD